MAENERPVYNGAIDAAYRLYAINGRDEYLDIAFNIAERAKAAVLLGKVSLTSGVSEQGRYGSLYVLDQKIRRAIAMYENSAKEAGGNGTASAYVREKLFDLYALQERFNNTVKEYFPEYYQTWVNPDISAVDDVKKQLGSNDCFITYHLGDSMLYTFVITNEQSSLKCGRLQPGFFNDVNSFREIVSGGSPGELTNENFRSFTSLSHSLYRTLLDSTEDFFDGKSLLISCDGILNYIPFEALLTEPADTAIFGYRDLPYLLKKHSVSYEVSASLFCRFSGKNQSGNSRILGFAPGYSDPGTETALYLKETGALPLKGTEEELKSTEVLSGGKLFFGKDALESNFRELADDYGILHLAMHGETDADDPFMSKLVFEDGGGTNDGILYAWEIYNMQMNPLMVVISACNTGSGKIRGGEGVMSLARAFMYAGSPSVIMTLWTVNDLSSKDIIGTFYSNLSDGEDKATALQKAKLTYLETASAVNSHPAYWAGYVAVGDKESLSLGVNTTVVILVFIAVIISILAAAIKAKRKGTGS